MHVCLHTVDVVVVTHHCSWVVSAEDREFPHSFDVMVGIGRAVQVEGCSEGHTLSPEDVLVEGTGSRSAEQKYNHVGSDCGQYLQVLNHVLSALPVVAGLGGLVVGGVAAYAVA